MTDIEALFAAIDGGDDSALPPLADALEEAGDPRAAGVRELLAWEGTLAPHRRVWGWRWYDHELNAEYSWRASVRLGESYAWLVTTYHHSRSAAIMGLAELIVEAGQGCFT